MTREQAKRVLKVIEDSIRGAQELFKAKKMDKIATALGALAVSNGVKALDFYLTPDEETRYHAEAHMEVMLLFAGEERVFCPLGDPRTSLVLQWPTEGDPRVAYLHPLSEDGRGVNLRRRWRGLLT